MMRWVFGADTTPFRRGLDEMRTQVKGFSGSVKGMLGGALGAGALTSWISSTIEAAGRIEDLSKRLNMSAESFQRISYASKLSGGDMEVVAKSLTILTKNLEAAKDGGDGFSNAAATLNVDLAKLAKMSPEDQIVELARGYQQSADKGAALAAIMKLLGKSGAEMIPLLSEGPEGLRNMMEEATVATDEQIAAMAKLGDAMDAFKTKSVSILGSMIDGVKIWGAGIEWGLNRATSGAEKAARQFDKRMAAITGEGEEKGAAAKNAAAAEEAVSVEKERSKLSNDIAKLKEEAMMRELDLAGQIFEIENKRAILMDRINKSTTENEALALHKESLEVEKELAKLKDQQSKDAEAAASKEADMKKDAADKIAALEAESAALDRDNMLNSMSEEDRMAELIKEQKTLHGKSIDAALKGDKKTELENRIAAQKLTPEIESLAKSIADKQNEQGPLPGIATSSLASIGAGGSANLLTRDTTAERQVSLLEIIARNTARSETGSVKIPEPI